MKRALIIGINYRGTSSELNGCINDVEKWSSFLSSKNYKITKLTEDSKKKPTRKNIIREITRLATSKSKELFFGFSGHGSYVVDKDGDEIDKRDECLVPLDYKRRGMISDDEIRGIFNLLTPDKKLFCVLDCCHSGTGIDLCYSLSPYFKYNKLKETKCQVIMLSGCKDEQYSADNYIDGKFQGALTSTFHQVYRENISYQDLIEGIRLKLKEEGYDQIPMLSSGQLLDLNIPLNF